MRVIGGNFKGKKLNLSNQKQRPLKDSVRESIFNILKHSNNINLKIESFKNFRCLLRGWFFWYRMYF